jgi:hypothetical protein
MPLPLQLPNGSVVLSNRFGDGPFADCERFVRVVLPKGIEIEGVYNGQRGVRPARYWLYMFVLRNGERSWTRGQRRHRARRARRAFLTSVARTILDGFCRAGRCVATRHFPHILSGHFFPRGPAEERRLRGNVGALFWRDHCLARRQRFTVRLTARSRSSHRPSVSAATKALPTSAPLANPVAAFLVRFLAVGKQSQLD